MYNSRESAGCRMRRAKCAVARMGRERANAFWLNEHTHAIAIISAIAPAAAAAAAAVSGQ